MGREGCDVQDPCVEGFELFRFTAKVNRKVYEVNFSIMYRDAYKKLKDVEGAGEAGRDCNPVSVDEDGLVGVRGFLVEAAPRFLEDEKLVPKVGTKAYLMPLRMFI